jgi:hypothetical protein
MIMTSERKLAANRINAKRSTGPRTEQGKSRAKHNALRHGLTNVTRHNAALSPEMERMANAICGKGATQLQYDQALEIAESEFMVLAVRAARVAATILPTPTEKPAGTNEPQLENEAGRLDCEGQSSAFTEDDFTAFQPALFKMTRYERYERRALSRRQRAIRRFVATSILRGRPLLIMVQAAYANTSIG